MEGMPTSEVITPILHYGSLKLAGYRSEVEEECPQGIFRFENLEIWKLGHGTYYSIN
jgi:hypothetical protein